VASSGRGAVKAQEGKMSRPGSILFAEKLDSVLEWIASGWENYPNIVAVYRLSGLPKASQKATEEQGVGAHDIHVIYDGLCRFLTKKQSSS
jgi:hypothetical protein